jgi:hypothetical protein
MLSKNVNLFHTGVWKTGRLEDWKTGMMEDCVLS